MVYDTGHDLRFIENFESLGFWSQNKTKYIIPAWSNFKIWGQKHSGDFMVLNAVGRTTEDILGVQTEYNNKQKFEMY